MNRKFSNNNWIHTDSNSEHSLKSSSNIQFKNVVRKKIIAKLHQPLNNFKNPITYVKNKKSSLMFMRHLLCYNNISHFFKKKNYILNGYFTLSHLDNKNRRISMNRIIHFYSNSMLYKKSGYSRAFSRTNKLRNFVTFKKFNDYSYLSSNLKLLELSDFNVHNVFLITIIFKTYMSFLFSNLYSSNFIRYSNFYDSSNEFTIHLDKYNTSTFSNYLNLIVYKNFIVSKSFLMNFNDLYYLTGSKCSIITYKTKILNNKLNSHLITGFINSSNFKDEVSSNSMVWSSFWNTLFMSNTKNISANSLFMSVSSSDQDYFLSSKSFFADFKFGNYYINYVPFTWSLNSDNIGLLFLTLKYNSSFFNNLKWRKYSTFSNINIRYETLLNSDSSFSDFYDNNDNNDNNDTIIVTDRVFELDYLKHTLFILNKDKIPYYLKHILYRRRFFSNTKNSFSKFIAFLKNLNSRFKKTISSSAPFSEDDFQPIPRIRHKAVNKDLFFFGNSESSIAEMRLKNIDHEESFFKTFSKNNFLHSQKSNFLHSQKNTPLYFNLRKLSDFINLISTPFYLKLNLKNLSLSKNTVYTMRSTYAIINSLFIKYFSKKNLNIHNNYLNNNLIPNVSFNYSVFKKISGSYADGVFTMSSTPWHYNSIIRFMEFCSGKKVLFQFYPFLSQSIEKYYVVTYKRWMTRMTYYERKLGHKFFLEEALHLIHLTLNLHDPKVMCTWLKAIIQRISFWKTRSIFRFLKYLFSQYFNIIMNEVGSKGLKICLRGKISAAGNSRTRTILYRTGQTSHANTSLKVLNEFMTIGTFTGVMGFQIWIFY